MKEKEHAAILENRVLREIDQFILKMSFNTSSKDLEDIFVNSLAMLAQMYGLDLPGHCLVFLGTGFRELAAGPRPILGTPIPIHHALSRFTRGQHPASFVSLSGGALPLNDVIVGPVYSQHDILLCLLILPVDRTTQPEGLPAAMNAILAQLTIAYRQFERERFHREMVALWNRFLEDGLSPVDCFRSLAAHVPRFLPVFGSAPIESGELSAQIMVLPDAEDHAFKDHIIIRGTTGSEHSGTRLSLSSSITGNFLADENRRIFCDNPNRAKYRRIFKDYFGENGPGILTEMIVRLTHDDKVVGVINLESVRPDAFTVHDQAAIMELSKIYGNFAWVLDQKVLMNAGTQDSVASSTSKYLEALSKVFSHGLKSPSTSVGFNNTLLNNEISDLKSLSKRIRDRVERGISIASNLDKLDDLAAELQIARDLLEAAFTRQKRYSDDFINDIAQYAEKGYAGIFDIISTTTRLAEHSLLVGPITQRIRMNVTVDKAAREKLVYCSTLVKQHLFSIFHNAVDALDIDDGKEAGQISVTVEREVIPGRREKKLNKSWAIKIRDNGAGVEPWQLNELRQFDPGTTFKSNGHGDGLVAAHRYVTSINGRIELDSKHGEYFEVIIFLEEYDPLIHGSLKRLMARN